MTWKELGLFGIGTPVVVLCLNVFFCGAAGEIWTRGKVARRLWPKPFQHFPFLVVSRCYPPSLSFGAIARGRRKKPTYRYSGGEGEDCRG